MATSQNDLVERVRLMLGDFDEPFHAEVLTDGKVNRFDLPVGQIDQEGFSLVVLSPAGTLDVVADYKMDYRRGWVTLPTIPPKDTMYRADGVAHSLFASNELARYCQEAVNQHCSGAWTTTRLIVDSHGNPLDPQPDIVPGQAFPGFIGYIHEQKGLLDLPPVEEYMIGLLACTLALWDLAVDATTDIDVITAEGTNIPRSQRFRQLQEIIGLLSLRYRDLAQQLNVGLYRIEVSFLRRVSRTTNRLVPLFVPQEYDDHNPPQRVLPPIDARDLDTSGIPSPGIRPLWDPGTGWHAGTYSTVGYSAGYHTALQASPQAQAMGWPWRRTKA